MDDRLTIALVNTIRVVRGTRGRLRDRLASIEEFDGWLADVADLLPARTAESVPRSDAARLGVIEVRSAVRSLFAAALAPDPPSQADADALPDRDTALATLDSVLAEVSVTPGVEWVPGEGLALRSEVDCGDEPAGRLRSTLALSAARFLADPARDQLRACPGPLCVLYFVREHNRQRYCSPACGNRARVTRHYHSYREGASAR